MKASARQHVPGFAKQAIRTRTARRPPPSDSPVKSAMRTLAILELFRERQSPLSVAEIADAIPMPQSSTSVLLRSLVALNYLEYRASTRRFSPTYRVTLLGDWIQQSRFGGHAITDVMTTLRDETGESVLLGLQTGPRMQYVHIVPAPQSVQLAIKVGEMRPMTRSALGQILLSRMPNAQIRAILRRNNADEPNAAMRMKERAFLDEMEVVRARGFSESRERMTPGANTLAMIAPSREDGALLALGIGGPSHRIAPKRERILKLMRNHLEAPLLAPERG